MRCLGFGNQIEIHLPAHPNYAETSFVSALIMTMDDERWTIEIRAIDQGVVCNQRDITRDDVRLFNAAVIVRNTTAPPIWRNMNVLAYSTGLGILAQQFALYAVGAKGLPRESLNRVNDCRRTHDEGAVVFMMIRPTSLA